MAALSRLFADAIKTKTYTTIKPNWAPPIASQRRKLMAKRRNPVSVLCPSWLRPACFQITTYVIARSCEPAGAKREAVRKKCRRVPNSSLRTAASCTTLTQFNSLCTTTGNAAMCYQITSYVNGERYAPCAAMHWGGARTAPSRSNSVLQSSLLPSPCFWRHCLTGQPRP